MPVPGTTYLLSVTAVSKSYGAVEALRDVTFSLGEGEIVGVVGPNGAGKTTLLECIEGLNPFNVGFISIFGYDVRHGLTDEIKQRIGVAPQFFNLPGSWTVREIVGVYESLYPAGLSAGDVLAKVGLKDKGEQRFGKLSGGQKRRLALALALIGNADLLFLDEPTGDLDPQSRRFIWDIILDAERRGARGVLIATHQMDEVEALCSRVLILDGGRILEDDTPDALINRIAPGHHIRLSAAVEEAERLRELFPHAVLTAIPNNPARVTAKVDADSLDTTLGKIVRLREVSPFLIEDVLISKNTLEDVFIKLTGRMLRE